MKPFLDELKLKAKKNPKKIVFPEGTEPRVIQAVSQIIKKKIAHPILIGNKFEIIKTAKSLKLKLDFKKITLIDPEKSDLLEKYMRELLKLRKGKGMSEKDAWKLVCKTNYFGTMMIKTGDADGMVCGSTWSTAETIRPALQIIKTKEKFHKVSGFFFMLLKKKLMIFADCAVNIDPNSHDLVDIAEDTAKTAEKFGIKPKIAFLSFSTNRSADHPLADKVREAVAIFKDRNPDFIADGEMQVDAALVPEICERKFPGSKLAGDANVLIFPDLQSGNISYKLVERLGKAIAIGPILQGLKKPVNDLSRGCSWKDIVDVTAITVIEAQEK